MDGEKPRNLTFAQFKQRYNVGTTKTYELVADGALTLRKVGRRSLLDADDAEAWWQSLPKSKPKQAHAE
jgi:excisionase family DNA binding protein